MIDMAKGYELSDSKWERISDFFPVSKIGCFLKWDNNVQCNYVACPQWFFMGRRYPPHQSIYSRFCKWRDADILETVFHILNADLENLSYIKANPQSGGAKKGHSIHNASHLLVQVMVEKVPKFMPL